MPASDSQESWLAENRDRKSTTKIFWVQILDKIKRLALRAVFTAISSIAAFTVRAEQPRALSDYCMGGLCLGMTLGQAQAAATLANRKHVDPDPSEPVKCFGGKYEARFVSKDGTPLFAQFGARPGGMSLSDRYVLTGILYAPSAPLKEADRVQLVEQIAKRMALSKPKMPFFAGEARLPTGEYITLGDNVSLGWSNAEPMLEAQWRAQPGCTSSMPKL